MLELNDDIAMQLSVVRRRSFDWKRMAYFIHPGHRNRSMKYSVIKFMNYDMNDKLEGSCNCNRSYESDFHSDSDTEYLSSSDDDALLGLDPWGIL